MNANGTLMQQPVISEKTPTVARASERGPLMDSDGTLMEDRNLVIQKYLSDFTKPTSVQKVLHSVPPFLCGSYLFRVLVLVLVLGLRKGDR